VFQRLGDGIVAFFGYPLVHEGEAERAIHAGLEIIATLSQRDVPEVGHLTARIGIATASLEAGPHRCLATELLRVSALRPVADAGRTLGLARSFNIDVSSPAVAADHR
jgi:hypothetical protein